MNAMVALDIVVAAGLVAAFVASLLTSRRIRIAREASNPDRPEREVPEFLKPVLTQVTAMLAGTGLNVTVEEALQVYALIVIVPPVALLVAGQQATIVLAALAACAALPVLWLSQRRGNSNRKFEEDLVDVLPMVASGLRSGLSLRQALLPAADGMGEPIHGEFARLGADLDRGVPADEAIYDMADRVDSSDLRILAAAVAVQRKTGGNLADIVDQVAETIRARVRARGEAVAKTSEARLEAKILTIMPIGIVIALIATNETVRNFYLEERMGPLVLLAVGLLILIAVVWMRRLVDIKIE